MVELDLVQRETNYRGATAITTTVLHSQGSPSLSFNGLRTSAKRRQRYCTCGGRSWFFRFFFLNYFFEPTVPLETKLISVTKHIS